MGGNPRLASTLEWITRSTSQQVHTLVSRGFIPAGLRSNPNAGDAHYQAWLGGVQRLPRSPTGINPLSFVSVSD